MSQLACLWTVEDFHLGFESGELVTYIRACLNRYNHRLSDPQVCLVYGTMHVCMTSINDGDDRSIMITLL